MHPQALTHAQIQHNLLTPTGNSIGTHIPVKTLDLAALPTTAVAEAAKDLGRLAGAELESAGALGLEAGDGTAQLEHRLRLVHGLALVDDVLEPVVGGFDLARHFGELHPDDGVVDQLLAEGAALVAVFHGLFIADAGEADALDDDADAFVVEVGHDH